MATTTTKKKSTSQKSSRMTKKNFLGYDIPKTAKIRVIGDNPRRRGSSVWKQYEKMRGGKTVAAYERGGGRCRWLPGAAARGYIAKLGRR